MPNLKTPIAYFNNFIVCRKYINKAIVFFSFILFAACNSTLAQNQTVAADASYQGAPAANEGSATLPFDNNLHILYLNNTSSNDQLNTILSAWKKPSGRSKKPRKIVFQFIYMTDNTVSLAAFPGRKRWGRSDYRQNPDPVILTVSPLVPATDADIKGKNVIFGDQEINIKKNDDRRKPINVLIDIAKNQTADNAYIYFTPKLVLAKGNTYIIQYELSYGNIVTAFSKPLVSTSLKIITNPSPPRNSY